ncbi:NACHT domain-containing protein [Dactylosporangium sp. NBC_01737]|uniref:NACHT domain-containing protein n=1 Tax=Dactylosporangium sp. NBC_01737 TaxID=2975959 RepID=UPI002E0E0E07|nr:NACHT domain-containing protein [Dactylosporangium sp. NBC_01737]
MIGRRGRRAGTVSQEATAADQAQINQVAGDQHIHHHYQGAETPAPDARRRLVDDVRAEESRNRAHLLGLDIIRPIGAKATYAVEHTARFRETDTPADAVHTDIAAFFTGVADRQLIILGPAGAGKSVLAVELLLALLRELGPDDPVPVRFDLASWDPAHDLGGWLTAQLGSRYGLPAANAKALLHERGVLPVLDGLDEISVEKEDLTAAVLAVNTFLADRSDTGYVLTCRNNVYSDIGRRIEPGREITVLPLTTEEVVTYIGGAVGGDRVAENAWQPVVTALRAPVPAVVHALSTPWRLTLAVTFFLDRGDTYELVPAEHESDTEYARRVGELLVKTFAPARARLHAIETREKADAWCTFIAEDLDLQVSRGGPRQDIIAHYSAERAWATALHHRALAAATSYVKVLLGLGALTLAGWLLDAVAGTPVVAGARALLEGLAGLRGAPLVAALAGGAMFAALIRGVPRARRTTRRLLRGPGPAHRTGLRAAAVGAGGFVLSALLTLPFFGLLVFLEAWPVAGAGTALRVAVTAGLVPAVCLGIAGGVQNATRYTFEVWHGHFLARGAEQPQQSAHARGISANWTFPSSQLDQILGTVRAHRNWPAAIETFLVDGYAAGIFRRSGDVYQFRHRQLQDWYARPVDPLRAWDNELPLPGERDLSLVHGVNMVYLNEGRAAAQQLVLGRRDGGARDEALRASAATAGRRIRPQGVLSRCDIHVVRALAAAEGEARATGSAVIQPWHVFVALLADVTRHHADCPARLDQVRAAFQPTRTVSPDESPGHLPLARSLRRVLVGAPARWDGRLRPEFILHDLLNAGDDPAHRAVLALRHPANTEQRFRVWLDERITRLRAGRPADTAAELAELAGVLLDRLDRPSDAERALAEAAELAPHDPTYAAALTAVRAAAARTALPGATQRP